MSNKKKIPYATYILILYWAVKMISQRIKISWVFRKKSFRINFSVQTIKSQSDRMQDLQPEVLFRRQNGYITIMAIFQWLGFSGERPKQFAFAGWKAQCICGFHWNYQPAFPYRILKVLRLTMLSPVNDSSLIERALGIEPLLEYKRVLLSRLVIDF